MRPQTHFFSNTQTYGAYIHHNLMASMFKLDSDLNIFTRKITEPIFLINSQSNMPQIFT